MCVNINTLLFLSVRVHHLILCDTFRHLDYFEMLRNDDELAVSKRFESVRKRNISPLLIM